MESIVLLWGRLVGADQSAEVVVDKFRRRSFATSAKETQKSSENDEQVSLQPCDYVTTILIISCFAQNTEKA